MARPLNVGDELHCPHCCDWHPVFAPNAAGTPATTDMLSWDCRGGRYFAGSIGGTARYETRRSDGRLRVRLYWADGRVEEPRQALDVMTQAQIVRRSGERHLHLHFTFTGVIDADGFAVYEESPDDRI